MMRRLEADQKVVEVKKLVNEAYNEAPNSREIQDRDNYQTDDNIGTPRVENVGDERREIRWKKYHL